MNIEVFADADAAARRGAALIAAAARDAIAARGQFVMAVSGGRSPWQMLAALAKEDLDWRHVHFCQVDERVAPAGDPDRNLTHLCASLASAAPLRSFQIHAMPVDADDLTKAAAAYAAELATLGGKPPVFDLIHLGLGPDGHTASLIPGDPVLNVTDVDVSPVGVYQGRRRLTLTYPTLNRARQILWLVTGADKVDAFARLRRAGPSIPAGRVNQDRAVVLADQAAARGI